MSTVAKNATLKALIDAVVTDLMVKTTGEQILLGDGSTLASKLADIISAINVRAKISYVDEEIAALRKAINTSADLTEVEAMIDALRQEFLGDIPLETYDTFAEIGKYIQEHEDICELLTESIGMKADKSLVDDIQLVLNMLGTLAYKDRVSEADLDAELVEKINNHRHDISDVNGLQAALDSKAVLGVDENGPYLETADGNIGLMTEGDIQSAMGGLGRLAYMNEVSESELSDELAEKINSTQRKIDEAVGSLGDLAGKDKVSEGDLDTALVAKVNDTRGLIDEAIDSLGSMAKRDDVAESNLNSELANKINNHGHDISDVSGLTESLAAKVPATRTINGKMLNGDIVLTAGDVWGDPAGAADNALAAAKEYTDDAIASVNGTLGDLANKDEVSESDLDSALAEKINSTQSKINEAVDSLGNLASKDEVSEAELSNELAEKINSTQSKIEGALDGLGDLASKDEVTRSELSSGLASELDTKVPNTRKVNGKALSGDINLTASDVGADSSGTAANAISTHDTSTDSHSDIRALIIGLTARLNAIADSDDTTLDQMSEVVTYIKSNKTLIESITTSKINVSDIANNLTTNSTSKVLSAAQGVAIKVLIDALQSELDTHEANGALHITANERSAWNTAKTNLESHLANTTVHITATERTNWNDANSKKHSHSNGAILDGIASTDISSWNDANSKKHSHSNKAILDATTASFTEEYKEQLDNLEEVVMGSHPDISTSDNTFSTAQLYHGGTVSMVDSVVRDDNGHVTAVNFKTATLPEAQADISGNAGTATKLETPRSVKVNLASTTAAAFDGSKDITPGVSGVLPPANGGTGQSSVYDAANAMINSLPAGTDTPQDGDYMITQYVNGGTTNTRYHRRPMSALWNYIKGKISSVLGLTASEYSGKAATATKLAASKTIQTDLGSTSAVGFDGSANVTPGVKGVLPITNGGTGASDRAGAVANLGTIDLASSGETIPQNADLNSYTTPGNYYAHAYSTTSTLSNVPNGLTTGFRLIVMQGYAGMARIHQFIFPDDHYVYARQCTNSNWTSWDRLNNSTVLSDLGITTSVAELNYMDGVTSNIQDQLNTKAPLASPALTGTPTAPTATAGTNSTQLATTAFVQSAVANLVDSAPETMNTLGEVAKAISAHQDVTDALNAAIGSKANSSDLTSHTGNTTVHITSTERTNWNDANSKKHSHSNSTVLANTTASYTIAEQNKLAGLATVATSGKYSDLSGTPTIPTKTSQLTNDSGYKTTDNNTTYSLSKSGSTITLTGSDGSKTSVTDSDTNTTYSEANTSTAGLMSAADKTNLNNALLKSGGTMTGNINIMHMVPVTAATYNIGSSTKALNNVYTKNQYLMYDSVDYGRFYISSIGSTSAVGTVYCILGNGTSSGTANNARGYLRMYGTGSGYTQVQTGNNSASNITLTLPSSGGTLATTSNLSSYLPLSGGSMNPDADISMVSEDGGLEALFAPGVVDVRSNDEGMVYTNSMYTDYLRVIPGSPYIDVESDIHFVEEVSFETGTIRNGDAGVNLTLPSKAGTIPTVSLNGTVLTINL